MSAMLTKRALLMGALFSLIINVFFAYARLAMATAGMSSDYITAGAIFLFFTVGVGKLSRCAVLARCATGLVVILARNT